MKRKESKHIHTPPITQLSQINPFDRAEETDDDGDGRGGDGGDRGSGRGERGKNQGKGKEEDSDVVVVAEAGKVLPLMIQLLMLWLRMI